MKKIYVWNRLENGLQVVDIYFSKPKRFTYTEWI